MSTYMAFERAKASRFIKTYGRIFKFVRESKDDYNEPDGKTCCRFCVEGVYHEQSASHIRPSISDGGNVDNSSSPMIFCLKDDITNKIQSDDCVEINGKLYTVTRIKDIGNAGIVLDISLEMIDDGTRA